MGLTPEAVAEMRATPTSFVGSVLGLDASARGGWREPGKRGSSAATSRGERF